MSVSQDSLKEVAERYWKLRNAGDLSETRTIAHNDLLDALEAVGIEYADREDAANIGKLIADGTYEFQPVEESATITFNVAPEVKTAFKRYAKRYGGMTAMLLRYVNDLVEKQTR